MNQRYRGIILVLIATLLFSVLDTSSKFLTAHYAAAQIVWHYTLIRRRTREGCFIAFSKSHWISFAVFCGIAAGLAAR